MLKHFNPKFDKIFLEHWANSPDLARDNGEKSKGKNCQEIRVERGLLKYITVRYTTLY